MIINDLFFKKYNIDKEKFEGIGITKDELVEMHNDYIGRLDSLENAAAMIAQTLRGSNAIHSIKYRIKDPEHLIEKIIRKKIENPDREISLENYHTEITDLIGIRVLHLFKDEWVPIHQFINEKWNLNETPVANIRDGDPIEIQNKFIEHECAIKVHKFGYRSVHYLITFQPQKETVISEIQVRTIFEEGWSEIDHRIRYPYWNNNPIITNYLEIFNRLAGSADEMGTFVKLLSVALKEMEQNHLTEIEKRDKNISELEEAIKKLKVDQTERDELLEKVKKLEKDSSVSSISYQPITRSASSISLSDLISNSTTYGTENWKLNENGDLIISNDSSSYLGSFSKPNTALSGSLTSEKIIGTDYFNVAKIVKK